MRSKLYRAIHGLAGDDDPWIRWKALRALGGLGADASRPVFEEAAGDPDFQVRFEAGRALRDLG